MKNKLCFKKMGIGLALLGGTAFGLFLRFYRPWHSRWGATDDEVILVMPGDELIEKPTFNVTRAITIQARPEEIWPFGSFRLGTVELDSTATICWTTLASRAPIALSPNCNISR